MGTTARELKKGSNKSRIDLCNKGTRQDEGDGEGRAWRRKQTREEQFSGGGWERDHVIFKKG